MRARRLTSIILAIVGGLTLVAGIILLVADRSVFDETTVRNTTETVAEDQDVQRLLAREITYRIVTLGDLETQRDQVASIVTFLLADDAVKADVIDGVMDAYGDLVDGRDDAIVFNLVRVAGDVRRQAVVVAPSLDRKLPPAEELLRFELFRREEMPGIYELIDTLRQGAWWILVVGAIAVGAALALGPGRFSIFALAAATTVVGMFVTATLISSASDNAIEGIEDPLTRRVTRLVTDDYLTSLNHAAVAVVIFGLIAFVAGLGGSWIKNALWPAAPHATKTW